MDFKWYLVSLLPLTFATDHASGCLINWEVEVVTTDSSGASIITIEQACYHYSSLLIVNITLLFVVWTSLMHLMMMSTH